MHSRTPPFHSSSSVELQYSEIVRCSRRLTELCVSVCQVPERVTIEIRCSSHLRQSRPRRTCGSKADRERKVTEEKQQRRSSCSSGTTTTISLVDASSSPLV